MALEQLTSAGVLESYMPKNTRIANAFKRKWAAKYEK